MLVDNEVLYKHLEELEVIDKKQLGEAFDNCKQQKLSLASLLLEKDLISDENLGKIVAEIISVPFISLSAIAIPNEILQIIPEVVAKKQKIIAFRKDKEGLHLAMADPANTQISSFVEKKAGIPVMVHFATDRDINNALSLYAKDVKKTFSDIIAENVAQAKGAAKNDPPIIKIVDTILTYAYQNKASDIHIEPQEKDTLVRFRIDGILHDVVTLPLTIHPQIITRIKVLSKLRTDEHQAAQDGKMQFIMDEEKLDIRVSIVPTTRGENAVLRLLSERSRQFSLIDLGLSATNLVKVRNAYDKPYGMILATGPTGCGKTTTMYAILKLLNKREVNISTIEDPVEYDIEGVNQIQVNPKTNLTFANGLRSIVRQDPNIILVGEIRDSETAGIAINAAMTGHLVLSTLHTNDAVTSIPRLMDMGIEPFLVGSTINIIIAQRLVRKICQQCRVSYELTNKKTGNKQKTQNQWGNTLLNDLSLEIVKKHFGKEKSIRLYRGKGCPVCHQTGYEGRVGIFEVLLINDRVRQAIVERKDAGVLKKIAVESKMDLMVDDGLEKVKQGVTTIEEILRVTKE